MLARIAAILVATSVPALAQSPQWALSPVSYPVNPAGGSLSVIVGDVNLDGRADVVGVKSAGVPSIVLLGQVGGGLHQLPGTPIGNVSGSPRAIGDLDNDGLPDLVLENVTLKGMGDGTFGPPVAGAAFIYSTGAISSCALGDVNGDGLADVAVTISVGFNDELRIALGKTGGGYYLPLSWTISGQGSRAFVSEATGDAVMDFVVSTPGGFGIASRTVSGTVNFQTYARNGAQVAAELTGDQWPDIYSPGHPLVVGSGAGLFTLGPQVQLLGSPSIAFNADGDGIFDLVAPTNVPTGTALVVARSLAAR